MLFQGILFLLKRLAVTMKSSVYILICVVASVGIFYFIFLSGRYEIVYERLIHVFPLYRYINLTVDHNNKALRSPVCLKYTQRQFVMQWYKWPVWVLEVDPFSSLNFVCECQNCKVTFNTTHIGNSDLVIFHHSELPIQAPSHKTSSQIGVFASWESVFLTNKQYQQSTWINKFDWTTSYRRDSEGYAPYGEIIPRKILEPKNYSSIFARKSKSVAWVVSHCKVNSKRMAYVKKMSKYIDIDIYGKCGKYTCDDDKDCKKKLSGLYKFYLAFENSLCKEYTTEKLFSLFQEDFNIIPVVRGAPDTVTIVPSNTYISTSDFNSPKSLALYLSKVASNETLYLSFLKEKDRFSVRSLPLHNYGVCSLCKQLNNNYTRQTPLDINDWYTNQCVSVTDM